MSMDTVTDLYKTPAGEFEIKLPADSPLLDRHAHPAYEPLVTERFADYINESTVFFDVGCRHGPYSLLASELGVKKDNIYSFDKNKQAISILQSHSYDEIGHLIFAEVGYGEDEIILDDYIQVSYVSVPDVIKMDIEGAEIRALRGACKLLEEHQPVLFIEIHPWRLRDNFDSHPDEVISLLQSAGYNHMEIAPSQRRENTGWKNLENYSFNIEDDDNALLAKVTDD